MRCVVSWSLGATALSGDPVWLLKDEAASDLLHLVKPLSTTLDDIEDEEDISQLRAPGGWAEDVTQSRLEAARAAVKKTHGLRMVFFPSKGRVHALDLGMRQGNTGARWESPLVAAQRGEGFAVVNQGTSTAVYRVSPLDIQDAIVKAVASAINRGELITVAADSSLETALSFGRKDDCESDTMPSLEVSMGDKGPSSWQQSDAKDPATAALQELARRHWSAYHTATAGILAQRRRIQEASSSSSSSSGGGVAEVEPWTRAEKFQKYGKLKSLAYQIRDRTTNTIMGMRRQQLQHQHPSPDEPALSVPELPSNMHELSRCELLTEQERFIVQALIDGHADLYGAEHAMEPTAVAGDEGEGGEEAGEGHEAASAGGAGGAGAADDGNNSAEEVEKAKAELGAEVSQFTRVLKALSDQTAYLLKKMSNEEEEKRRERDGSTSDAAGASGSTKGASLSSALAVLQHHARQHSHAHMEGEGDHHHHHHHHDGHHHDDDDDAHLHGNGAASEAATEPLAASSSSAAVPPSLTPQQRLLALLHRGKMEAAATAGIVVKPLASLRE